MFVTQIINSICQELFNKITILMKWEDLKFYKTINKDELKFAKKEIEKIVFSNLSDFGFKKYGRELIRISNDVFHVIHLDTRGSWMGASTSLKTKIGIVSIYDTDFFIEKHELTGCKKLEQIIPTIKNYYQITQEYILFADFISRKLIENIIPYFKQFENSKDVLSEPDRFKVDNLTELIERNQNLILYCRLANHQNKEVLDILEKKMQLAIKLNSQEKIMYIESLMKEIQTSNWRNIDNILQGNKERVLDKLKLK